MARRLCLKDVCNSTCFSFFLFRVIIDSTKVSGCTSFIEIQFPILFHFIIIKRNKNIFMFLIFIVYFLVFPIVLPYSYTFRLTILPVGAWRRRRRPPVVRSVAILPTSPDARLSSSTAAAIAGF